MLLVVRERQRAICCAITRPNRLPRSISPSNGWGRAAERAWLQLHRDGCNQPGFLDNSFDNVICVEAAFHFDTREAFLREANPCRGRVAAWCCRT